MDSLPKVVPTDLSQFNTQQIADLLNSFVNVSIKTYYDTSFKTTNEVNSFMIVNIARLSTELTSRYILSKLS